MNKKKKSPVPNEYQRQIDELIKFLTMYMVDCEPLTLTQDQYDRMNVETIPVGDLKWLVKFLHKN